MKCDLDKDLRDSVPGMLKIIEGRNRSVYLHVSRSRVAIPLQDFPSVLTLSMDRCNYYILPKDNTYPQLVNLFLTGCDLDSRYLSQLAEASARGRLPKLSTLDISSNPDISGNLSVLLSQCFPSLHTLILSKCKLQKSDAHSLAQARKRARLPQLRHLDLSFNSFSPFRSIYSVINLLPLLFQQEIPTLNTLIVRYCDLIPGDLYIYPQTRGCTKLLSELTTLDMSYSCAIEGSLSTLMCNYLLHLQVLVLRKCDINPDDLHSLSEASSQGRLPALRHLDISQNYMVGEKRGLLKLFGDLKSFPSLLNLLLHDCHLKVLDLCCLRQAKLDGKLPRIRHLDISLNRLSDDLGILSRDPTTQLEISWENVKCCEKVDTDSDAISWGSVVCYDKSDKFSNGSGGGYEEEGEIWILKIMIHLLIVILFIFYLPHVFDEIISEDL